MDAELEWIAKATRATNARRGEHIQSLWSGYGELFRVYLVGAAVQSVVVKAVNPPPLASRAASHLRKCRSYDVEMTWYRTLAAQCDDACRVPALFGSRVAEGRTDLALEDLDATGFPVRRRTATSAEIDVCLAWLASFHARFLGTDPVGLWEVGTYWHLSTRFDELDAMEDEALRAAASILDERLRAARFQTFVHGDAKLANFCFRRDASAVAAVDFQYVGGGCGMKDVAYLLCGHFEDEELEGHHLENYFRELRGALVRYAKAVDGGAVEAEWRALYPLACADYYRFLAGWAKEHWRADAHGRAFVRRVLARL